MSFHKRLHTDQKGFTLIELVVVITLIGVISTAAFTFFNTSVNQYLAIQQDGMVFGDLAQQSQRVAQVVRGLTDITAANANDLTIYAYFYPNDSYVSLVHYYKSTDGTQLFADVTPLTSNPPTGTLITSKKKTYTIISALYSAAGVNLFSYMDSYGTTLTLPITDLHTIKEIQVNLAVPVKSPSTNGSDAMSLTVSLRNRKTNL